MEPLTLAVKADLSVLSPAHHEAARGWEDRQACLEWAAEQEANVKEMIAYHNITNTELSRVGVMK